VDGPHDLGGRAGFGPVQMEADEPVFHDAWEGRVYACVAGAATNGLFGTPEFRHSMERMAPRHYLAASYYERWLTGVATLLVEKGTLTQAELDAAAGGHFPLAGPVRAPRVADPGPEVTAPRYAVGDEVRVADAGTDGHTRCPGYVRGRRGVVVRYDGPCNFDDVEAHSDGRRLEPLYSVRFDGVELWGGGAEPGVTVAVDLFESYLERP
jgi:nitrile hydratase